VALTTLDSFCRRFSWQYKADGKTHNVNPIVRYADDFTIVCRTEKEAKMIKSQIAQHLKEAVGVELSGEKTQITHIAKGFNFLGFHFRKYNRHNRGNKKSKKRKLPKRPSSNWKDYVLLIKPQRESIGKCKRKIKSFLKKNKTLPQSTVIHQLNAILRGWGNYYRHVVSKEVFRAVDYDTFWKCFRWARKRHKNKSKKWVINRYFCRRGRWKLSFVDRNDKRRASLVKLSEIPIKRHVKVSRKYRVYQGTEEAIEYWKRREYFKAWFSTEYGSIQEKLFRNQKGLCAWCKTPVNSEEIQSQKTETHHMKPQQFGGEHKLRNLRLLHTECHRSIHRLIPRKQMAELIDNEINYLMLERKTPLKKVRA
jgi:RNA-directed DNA polymerase